VAVRSGDRLGLDVDCADGNRVGRGAGDLARGHAAAKIQHGAAAGPACVSRRQLGDDVAGVEAGAGEIEAGFDGDVFVTAGGDAAAVLDTQVVKGTGARAAKPHVDVDLGRAELVGIELYLVDHAAEAAFLHW